ncbi:hypothetical protein SJ301_32020, partial [Klebsiella pneumoniae]|uniref:hypothetical protein n=1 Tax=Klebsiella pneumoniae TaxID=573 RepID=UPI0029DA0110
LMTKRSLREMHDKVMKNKPVPISEQSCNDESSMHYLPDKAGDSIVPACIKMISNLKYDENRPKEPI